MFKKRGYCSFVKENQNSLVWKKKQQTDCSKLLALRCYTEITDFILRLNCYKTKHWAVPSYLWTNCCYLVKFIHRSTHYFRVTKDFIITRSPSSKRAKREQKDLTQTLNKWENLLLLLKKKEEGMNLTVCNLSLIWSDINQNLHN